uniref:Putative cytochrome P450 6a14 n=1 Tax=Anoplophora glabripennis TaxID=217634 RepID=V5GTA8_ANOGL
MACHCSLLDVLAVISTLLAVGYAYIKWKYSYWSRKNIPYIEPSFPFGNLPNPFFGGNPESFGDRTTQLYKEAKAKGYRHLGMYFMLRKAYLVVDLELVKNVMTKDFQHFVDRGVYTNEKDDPLSAHLFALEGKKWRNLRTKLTPTFTSGKMRAMFQTLVDCGLVLEQYIEGLSNTKEPINIKDVLGCFSTDIIGSCAFGLDCNSFEDPNSPFREYGKKIFQPYSKLRSFFRILMLQNYSLARIFGVRQTKKEASDFFMKVVEDTIAYRKKNNYVRNDFLQLLTNSKEGKENDGDMLTMNEIVAQSYVFFIAGFETSSSAMTFALFELSMHPEIQDKVRDEIRTVLAKHDNQMTYDSLNELKYMGQVIDETLRKYAPLSFLTRECVEDYKVPGEDFVVEKGTRVLIPVRGIHYDEEFYPNPEKFDPERFTEENKKNRSQYTFLPFGEGPRICIGLRFGIMESKVGLTSILRKFKVTLNEKTEVPLKMNPRAIVTTSEGGIWLNLEKL